MCNLEQPSKKGDQSRSVFFSTNTRDYVFLFQFLWAELSKQSGIGFMRSGVPGFGIWISCYHTDWQSEFSWVTFFKDEPNSKTKRKCCGLTISIEYIVKLNVNWECSRNSIWAKWWLMKLNRKYFQKIIQSSFHLFIYTNNNCASTTAMKALSLTIVTTSKALKYLLCSLPASPNITTYSNPHHTVIPIKHPNK